MADRWDSREQLEELRGHLRTLFVGNVAGEAALAWLEHYCHANARLYDGSTEMMLLREGRREVYLALREMISDRRVETPADTAEGVRDG